jgi:hypothetical protein
VLVRRVKRILGLIPTTDLTLGGIAVVEHRQRAEREDKRNKKRERRAGAVR